MFICEKSNVFSAHVWPLYSAYKNVSLITFLKAILRSISPSKIAWIPDFWINVLDQSLVQFCMCEHRDTKRWGKQNWRYICDCLICKMFVDGEDSGLSKENEPAVNGNVHSSAQCSVDWPAVGWKSFGCSDYVGGITFPWLEKNKTLKMITKPISLWPNMKSANR